VTNAIVVSEDSRAYLSYTFPRLPVHRVRLGIDPAVHHPAPKKRQLCFMARKQVEDARQVLNILKHRGALTAYSAVPVQQMRHQEAAAILRESAVFLSFGHPEGFGLPAAEAMACGCVVVGYHGNGGREFFTPEHGFPIEAGDIIGFARTAEYVLTTLSRDSAAFNELTKSASDSSARATHLRTSVRTFFRVGAGSSADESTSGLEER
jgi:hypothetical protein